MLVDNSLVKLVCWWLAREVCLLIVMVMMNGWMDGWIKRFVWFDLICFDSVWWWWWCVCISKCIFRNKAMNTDAAIFFGLILFFFFFSFFFFSFWTMRWVYSMQVFFSFFFSYLWSMSIENKSFVCIYFIETESDVLYVRKNNATPPPPLSLSLYVAFPLLMFAQFAHSINQTRTGQDRTETEIAPVHLYREQGMQLFFLPHFLFFSWWLMEQKWVWRRFKNLIDWLIVCISKKIGCLVRCTRTM